jgi:hypothetical protein
MIEAFAEQILAIVIRLRPGALAAQGWLVRAV